MSSIGAFFETAARLGPRLAWKHGSRETSWREAAASVRSVARALMSLGVRPGQAVSIVGPNRPEWVLADLAAMAIGAVPAPLYPTLTAEQMAYITGHSEAVVAVAADKTLLDKLRAQRPPSLRWLVLIEGTPDAPDVLSWEQFLARAEETPQGALDERLAQLSPDGLATLIYTSGTTGPPKAVMLSHRNLEFAARAAQRFAGITPDDVAISYLPLSHIAEQMITIHAPAVCGTQIWFCDQMERLGEALREARPTFFVGVPRVWEKIQAGIEQKVATAPPLRQKLFRWALRSRGFLAERVVRSKVRAALGLDRVKLCITAAAKSNPDTVAFFDALGIPVMDLWGLSESTAMGASNLPGARKLGTVGRPIEGTELKIAPDGEILTRGAHVFLGYFKDSAATRDAIDAEGWLHTGDVGELDSDGYLRITDRKKDLLITSGGKNVSPQNIEVQLARLPGVAQAVVVGDARKYLAALIVPQDLDKATDPRFVEQLGREIEKLNQGLAQFETIKKFKVLPAQFSIDTGELTPTMKLKRKVVAQRYAKEIEELFA